MCFTAIPSHPFLKLMWILAHLRRRAWRCLLHTRALRGHRPADIPGVGCLATALAADHHSTAALLHTR